MSQESDSQHPKPADDSSMDDLHFGEWERTLIKGLSQKLAITAFLLHWSSVLLIFGSILWAGYMIMIKDRAPSDVITRLAPIGFFAMVNLIVGKWTGTAAINARLILYSRPSFMPPLMNVLVSLNKIYGLYVVLFLLGLLGTGLFLLLALSDPSLIKG
jgi:hypothetical protein